MRNKKPIGITGFQTPADRYLESILDLNDFVGVGRPGIFIFRVENDYPEQEIFRKDYIIVDRGCAPSLNSVCLAVLDGDFTIQLYGDLRLITDREWNVEGVIRFLLRPFNS